MKKRLLILLPILVLFSCSLQKRRYQSGFYVSWKHSKTAGSFDNRAVSAHAGHETPLKTAAEVYTPVSNTGPAASARVSGMGILADPKPVSLRHTDPCDNILFNDGKELQVKLIEIGTDEIKYKRCDTPDGPLYTVKKSEVFMVRYANGSKEVFKQAPATRPEQNAYPPNSRPGYNPKAKLDPLAVMSVIFGVLGIYPLIGIASIVAIILGQASLRRIRQQPDKYRGDTAATVGKTFGIVGLCLALLYILMFVFLIFLM